MSRNLLRPGLSHRGHFPSILNTEGGRGAHREKEWKKEVFSSLTTFTLVFLLLVEGTISSFLQRKIMELQLAQFCEMIAIIFIVGNEMLTQKKAIQSNQNKTLHILFNILMSGQCCMTFRLLCTIIIYDYHAWQYCSVVTWSW